MHHYVFEYDWGRLCIIFARDREVVILRLLLMVKHSAGLEAKDKHRPGPDLTSTLMRRRWRLAFRVPTGFSMHNDPGLSATIRQMCSACVQLQCPALVSTAVPSTHILIY